MNKRQPLSWVVDGFDNGYAVLKSQNGQLKVPRADLPDKCQEGDVLTADFFYLKDASKRKNNIARALLEEILGAK